VVTLGLLFGSLVSRTSDALEALPNDFRMSGTIPALQIGDLRWAWNGDISDNKISVPVMLLAGSETNFVQFSIDYDPEWLTLSRVRRVEAGEAGMPENGRWYLSAVQPVAVDRDEGRVMGVVLRPGGSAGRDKKERNSMGETLFFLEFEVAVEYFPGRQNRLELDLGFTHFDPASLTQDPREESVFGDLQGDEDDGSVEPIEGYLVDGRLELFYDDGIEVGDGRLTARAQEIVVPIYATRLSRTDLITTGVDYDELILRTSRIRAKGRGRVPGGDLTMREVPFSRKPNGAGIVFQLEIAPAMNAVGGDEKRKDYLLREHVADLYLLYEGPITSDALAIPSHRGDVGASFRVRGRLLEEDHEGVPSPHGVSLGGELVIDAPWFVRGNVNSRLQGASNETPGYPRGISAAFDPARVAPTLGDGLTILEWLFRREPRSDNQRTIGCVEAADLNDDGVIKVNDAILLFHYLYTGGSEPASPFPIAGTDAGDDDVGCEKPLPVFSPSAAD